MIINGKSVAVVLPEFNAEITLRATVAEILYFVDYRILVDDGSSDSDCHQWSRAGIGCSRPLGTTGTAGTNRPVIVKRFPCGADITIMIHPDYQRTPRLTMAMAGMVAFGFTMLY